MTQFTKEVPELFVGMKGKTRSGNLVVLQSMNKHATDCFNLQWSNYKSTDIEGNYMTGFKSSYDIVEWELKDAKEEEQDDVETECDIGNKELSASINKIYITQKVGEATLHINIESNEPLIELVCAAATLLNQE